MAKVTLGDLISEAPLIRCEEGSYPVLSMTMHDGIMLQSDRFKKNIASVDQSAYKVVQKGQLVVGFPIDEGVLYIQKVVEKGVMSPAYNIWEVNTQIIDSNYLEYSLHSPYSMEFYKSKLRGTTARRRSLPTQDLLSLPIPLPDYDKQLKIVSTLDKILLLISLRKQQISKLGDLVKSRFVEMFGDPVINPMGWKCKRLIEVCDKLTDGTHSSPESFPTGEYKYVTAKNVKRDGFDFSNITYVTADAHNEIYARCNPEFGDVLYIKDGVTTGIAMVNTLHEPFTMLSSVALLKQNRSMVCGRYLCSLLNNDAMYDDIRENMGGAAITRLTINKLNDILIPVAPLDLQRRFAAFVQQVDKSKFEIQKSLEKLETLKKALMQQYFG